jgi:hypothetical protein
MKTALVPAVLAFATVAFAAGTHKTEVVAPHQQEIAAKKSTIDELHPPPAAASRMPIRWRSLPICSRPRSFACKCAKGESLR